MEKLLEALKAVGVNLSGDTDKKQVFSVAKAMGIDPDVFVPRRVEIVEYTNKRKETNMFVKTPAFDVGVDEGGKKQTVQGLFFRIDALDQAITYLTEARELLVQG